MVYYNQMQTEMALITSIVYSAQIMIASDISHPTNSLLNIWHITYLLKRRYLCIYIFFFATLRNFANLCPILCKHTRQTTLIAFDHSFVQPNPNIYPKPNLNHKMPHLISNLTSILTLPLNLSLYLKI